MLGVSEDSLRRHDAVSSQVAEEMALRALKVFGSSLALSVMGIAGPGGGTAKKPVGLVYLAIAGAGGQVKVKKEILGGDRERVVNMLCLYAFDMIRRATLGLQYPE